MTKKAEMIVTPLGIRTNRIEIIRQNQTERMD
jgi:hypothetical protein